jgi:uracil-DNA glycosylase
MNSLINLQSQMRGCRRCVDAGFRVTPGAVFTGNAKSRVIIIGQAPGITEVAAKRPFNAGSGRRLFSWLSDAGWEETEFRKMHYMTAVTKCYPGKNSSGRGDRVPSKSEQSLCRPYLEQEIALIQPALIIPVGGLAIKLFFSSRLRLNEIIGSGAYIAEELLDNRAIVNLAPNSIVHDFNANLPHSGRWFVPLPHPSGASLWPNQPENQELISRAIKILGQIRTTLDL